MVQRGNRRTDGPQSAGLAGESLSERGPITDAVWQDLQRDDPVQLCLSCLVNRPHAAFANKLQDLQLREQRRKIGDGRGIELAALAVASTRLRRRALLQQTSGA